jgi:hypothetical protein
MPSLARRATEIFSVIPPDFGIRLLLAEIFSVNPQLAPEKRGINPILAELAEIFSVKFLRLG